MRYAKEIHLQMPKVKCGIWIEVGDPPVDKLEAERAALLKELAELDSRPDDGPADVFEDRRRAIGYRLDEIDGRT